MNGTGYLEPGDKAAISGDFELYVPFIVRIGENEEPYTDINLVISNPTYLSPTDNSTKESIDNSLDQASMSSYIENNSIFVGSVSILVSTDENYFPLNFDDLGDASGISDCITNFPCPDEYDDYGNIVDKMINYSNNVSHINSTITI